MKIRFLTGCVLDGTDRKAGEVLDVEGIEKGLDIVLGAGLVEVLVPVPEETPETPEESTEGEDPTDEPDEPKTPAKTAKKSKKK